jgi:maltooligosyltrehalose trehalohydrolase
MKRAYVMPFGAQLDEEGTRFRLWAPSAERVAVKVQTPDGARVQADLQRSGSGWYELRTPDIGAGASYRYRIDDEIEVPDPASRFNPRGVHEASEVIDAAAFEWEDSAWRGRSWNEAVIYEMHVGTFTPLGTFAAIVPRLDELAALGVTAIELMPVNAFAGMRGWGYDGVLPYAPHAAYGRPHELKALVQAAHRRGIMMLLDVVYNHFGPDGNYLPRYARNFFTKRHHTPWGDAIDFGQLPVRQFFIQNALYWLEEYRFDGLRIDAVHAMHDDSERHFIDELIDTVRRGPGSERHVHIVLENHNNEAHRLGPGVAQWNDDFHHPLHVLLTGETDGYYEDFAARPLEQLGRVLAEGFAFQGELSHHSGLPRGEPSAKCPPGVFVNFLQTHDQVGNRACGERIAHLSEPERLQAAMAIALLAPQPPMLFMGEEYAAAQPFLYFCDFHGELADAVRNGRRNEFAKFLAFASERARDSVPDPNSPQTFARSTLVWEERDRSPHREWLEYTRALLVARAKYIAPLIADVVPGQATHRVRQQMLAVRWPLRTGQQLLLQANLGAIVCNAEPVPRAALIFSTSSKQHPDPDHLQAWEVRALLVERP